MKDRSKKVRIPRKLKKAAKRGLVSYMGYSRPSPYGILPVGRKFKIVGKRTNWKVKALHEAWREHKRFLLEQYKRYI